MAEIAGGWLYWQAFRGRFAKEGRPFYKDKKSLISVVAGSISLISYGLLPLAQPPPTFGRLYAVYGGFFVLLSYVWGWLVDGDKPDKGESTAFELYTAYSTFPCLS